MAAVSLVLYRHAVPVYFNHLSIHLLFQTRFQKLLDGERLFKLQTTFGNASVPSEHYDNQIKVIFSSHPLK